jgi:glycine/D-amino acid oxidase-like deaminating enzyme
MGVSYWERESFVSYDCIIVGAGLVGLSTAASLLERQRNLRILILERGLLPAGASTKNAGFATAGSLSEIISDVARSSIEQARSRVEQRVQGLQRLRNRLGDAAIGYEATGNYELLFPQEEEIRAQLATVNTWLADTAPSPFYVDVTGQLPAYGFPTDKVSWLIHCPTAGILHTGRLMQSLQRYVSERGATILTGADVVSIQGSGPTAHVHVQRDTAAVFTFCASQVAVCSNAFAADLLPNVDVTPGRGQVIVTRPVQHVPFTGGFHFDSGFYYFRSLGDRVMFGGGRNLDVEGETTTELNCTALIQNDLESKLRSLILPGQSVEVDYSWAGIMGFTASGAPVLQRVSPTVSAGVALNGIGVAIGSYVGDRLAEIVLGNSKAVS